MFVAQLFLFLVRNVVWPDIKYPHMIVWPYIWHKYAFQDVYRPPCWLYPIVSGGGVSA